MKFSPSHEWILIENGIGTVGITKYAKEELGDIVYIQLPEVGRKYAMGEEVAVLESTKAAADIYIPISGEITEVNSSLQNNTGALNADPEKSGWLFKMSISSPEEVEFLLNKDQYHEMILS